MEGGTPLELALRDNYEAQRQLSKIIDEGVEIIKKERDEEWEKDLELWLLRLHNEPELWTVEQALEHLTLNK